MSNNGNGKRPTFAIYPLAAPGGNTPTDWPKALTRVLAAHWERCDGDPASVVVNKSVVEQVAEALREMGLVKLAVTSSGGCLTWEAWLEIPAEVGEVQAERGDDGRGLLARALDAQEEMTPERAREMLAEVEQLSLVEEVEGDTR